MTIRTRFAPSPTGSLHVGGARTALYCWLQARGTPGGVFILRIEDTDLERSSQASVQAILDGMEWLGLDCDEGPYYQTQRFDRYAEVVQQLQEEGKAYPCYCSKERIEAVREEQMRAGIKPRYDGHCRELEQSGEGKPVIRFRNPQEGSVVFEDRVRGRIAIANDELDDLVIARSDGSPTYNFTVVVDDLDMGITLVIRGDDHINNTPRQINIYRALGADPPEFAHVPMILGEDGARLSKRHGAVGVMQYREIGYLPQALLNYLVRLGWSHGDQEVFSIEEMIELFEIDDVNRKAAAFDHAKLDWLNQQWMKHLPSAEVAEHLAWQFERLGIDPARGPALKDLVSVQAERVKTLREMAEQSRVFYQEFRDFDPGAAKKHLRPVAEQPLAALRNNLGDLQTWSPEALNQVVRLTAEELEVGMGKVAQPLRVALVGSGISPSIDHTLWLCGKDRALARITHALEYVAFRAAQSG